MIDVMHSLLSRSIWRKAPPRAGICGSDLHLSENGDNKQGLIMGREFCGTVADPGALVASEPPGATLFWRTPVISRKHKEEKSRSLMLVKEKISKTSTFFLTMKRSHSKKTVCPVFLCEAHCAHEVFRRLSDRKAPGRGTNGAHLSSCR